MPSIRIAVVGGGAAGMFAAISAAEANEKADIVVFEKSSRFLSKVKISGGGRCNVTHACFDPKELIGRYPRGSKALLGPFYRWQPRDMVEWLEWRGVDLKTEGDGRMFPTTDSSQTIIDCLMEAANDFGIQLQSRTGVDSIRVLEDGRFELSLATGSNELFDRLIIASGGGKSMDSHSLATSLGHSIAPLAPSLFTFHINDPRIDGLQGLSVGDVTVSCDAAKLTQNGPLLITHWGTSGPAILKLSAWGARFFAERDYRFEISVNWTGSSDRQSVLEVLSQAKKIHGAKQVGSQAPFELPKRLWERLLAFSGIDEKRQYSQLSKAQASTLADTLVDSRFHVSGKSMNKEEFVTCGGVNLNEIDFKRMESKLQPMLFFAGEALDIDGVTGGFNFQAAWTTGRIAGQSAAEA
jgi:predicted Rossmann fold flavoprotein